MQEIQEIAKNRFQIFLNPKTVLLKALNKFINQSRVTFGMQQIEIRSNM